VLREQEADQVTAALRGVIAEGTGTRADIRLDAAGKTGTTEDARDAWFVGYTCNLTTAVWMGYAGREGQVVEPMKGILGLKEVTGGSLPASMWSAYMDAATEGVEECDLTPTTVEYGGRVLNPGLSTSPPPPAEPPVSAGSPTSTTTVGDRPAPPAAAGSEGAPSATSPEPTTVVTTPGDPTSPATSAPGGAGPSPTIAPTPGAGTG